jgi:hypothetical protein
LSSHCRSCRKERASKYYDENKDSIIKKAREWELNNPDKRKEIVRKYWSKESTKQKDWNRQLKRKYGISLQDYEQLLAETDHKCQICGKTEEENGKRLAVDHCHKTEEVRGILCDTCNTGLGMFLDNTNLLNKAIEYLSIEEG